MELIFEKDQFESKVYYGETFAATLPSLDYQDKHLLVITNQRYYDLFSGKINQLLPDNQKVDWYICTNQTYCNVLEEFDQVLVFMSRFSQEEEYLFLAFGNEGVIDLTSYIQKNLVLKSEFWVLPVSIRSFAQALTIKHYLLTDAQQPILKTRNLPQLILYDQTLTQEQTTGKMVDLLIFITCGIIADRTFLNELYFNFPNQKNLQQIPFSAMIGPMIRFYQESGDSIEDYGKVFERAFFKAEGGQLLSGSMKRMLGILFHFKWNIDLVNISFNFKNFLIWLDKLGYPLLLPKEFLVSDYVEHVLNAMKKSQGLSCLQRIGKLNGFRRATAKELLQTVESYKKIVEEIGE